MSAVETIRDIPVIVDHRRNCNADFEPMVVNDHDYDSGFPFDNTRRSRDPLEDIAQRHPELAQHLQGFPRRSQRTGDQDDDEYLRNRFERPFSGGRFERFGFPFDREDFEREPQRYYKAYPQYFENLSNQPSQSPPQQQSQASQDFQPHSPQYSQEYHPQHSQQTEESQQQSQQPQYYSQVSQGTQTECEPEQQQTEGEPQEQKGESGQARGRPIQQSNTCDLGQSSPADEAVNDRNQRSMSLPPENKRYTSSINIPMGGHQGQETGGAKAQSQASSSGSTERVIPIHVEGRDDPVLPKNVNTASASHPQPERIFTDAPPRPQTETIFGQRPERFTQFVNRDPHRFSSDWHHPFERDFPEEDFGFARAGSPSGGFARAGSPSRFSGARQQQHGQQPAHEVPVYAQHHAKQEATPRGFAPPQAAPKPQPQEPQKSAQDEAPQPQPPKQPSGPIEQIQAIQKDVSELISKVEAFNGFPRDKNYLYLDEMLTRNLLKLDNVDTQGQDSIRQARKEAIKCIERTISLLESKAAANAATKEQKMEVEPTQVTQEGEKMETEIAQASQEPSTMDASSAASQQPKEESDKSTQQSKSGENVESTQDQAKVEEKQSQGEVKNEEPKEPSKENVQNKEEGGNKETEAKSDEMKNSETKSETGEVKEEKKEKKKIKKKVPKEDKEKKQ